MTEETTDQDPADPIVDLEAVHSQEKCIKQFVMNARRNVKFHSNLLKANPFTARIVILRKSRDTNNIEIFFK